MQQETMELTEPLLGRGIAKHMLAIVILSLAWWYPLPTWAAESFCPGGSNPNPNVIWCDDFEDGTWTDTWSGINDWGGNGEAARCGTLGYNSNCTWRAGPNWQGPGDYATYDGTRNHGTTVSEIYVRFYTKFLPGWVFGAPVGSFNDLRGDKGVYLCLEETSGGCNVKWEWGKYCVNYPEGKNPPWDRCRMAIESYTISGPAPISGDYVPQNLGNDIIYQPNQWYFVKIYLKLNTPGQSNGILRVWSDPAPVTTPTLRMEYTNISLRSGSTNMSRIFLSGFSFRCNSGCPSSITKTLNLDQLVVSGADIPPMSVAGQEPKAPTNLRVISP